MAKRTKEHGAGVNSGFDPRRRLQTIRGTCEALAYGRTKVRQLIAEGKLVVVGEGRDQRVTTASINAYSGQAS